MERCKKRLLDQLMKDLFAMLRKWNFILTIITLKNYNKERSIIKFTITTARMRLAWLAFKGRNWKVNYWESPDEKGQEPDKESGRGRGLALRNHWEVSLVRTWGLIAFFFEGGGDL